MKIKSPIIKIIFIFTFFGFLYLLYKDLKALDNLKGYYITQSYFFLFLSLITFVIIFFDKLGYKFIGNEILEFINENEVK